MLYNKLPAVISPLNSNVLLFSLFIGLIMIGENTPLLSRSSLRSAWRA